MPSILKKEFGKVDRFFKKNVANPTNKFFKKGGQFQQAVGGVSGVLEKGGSFLGKGVKIGNQILDVAAKSPFGSVLSPALGIARGVLGSAGAISNMSREGGHILQGINSGKGVKHITNNTLEAAKRMEKESNKINFA